MLSEDTTSACGNTVKSKGKVVLYSKISEEREIEKVIGGRGADLKQQPQIYPISKRSEHFIKKAENVHEIYCTKSMGNEG